MWHEIMDFVLRNIHPDYRDWGARDTLEVCLIFLGTSHPLDSETDHGLYAAGLVAWTALYSEARMSGDDPGVVNRTVIPVQK